MKLLTYFSLIFFTTVLSINSYAKESNYTPIRITQNVHVIYGSLELPNKENRGFRSNTVVVLTSKGVVLLDSGGSAYAGTMIVKAIKKITSKPIVAIFNSHAHGDHWLGNESIKQRYPAVDIYGHPKMITKIKGASGKFWLNSINKATEGMANGKKIIVPNKATDNGQEINIGDTLFRIHHKGPSHSDNDIMIEIVNKKIIYTGDIVRNKLIGLMQQDSNFKNNISTIDFIINRKFKYVIPGHGKSGGSNMPKDYRNILKTIHREVKRLYEIDKADYEMKEEITKTLSSYKNWSGFELRIGALINRAYLEIEADDF